MTHVRTIERESGDPCRVSGGVFDAPLSRRHFVRLGLSGMAGGAVATTLVTGGTARTARADGLPRLAGGSLPERDELIFLVERTSQGFSMPAYEEALGLGWQGYLDRQLDPESIDDSELEARLALMPTLGMSARQLYIDYAIPNRYDVPFYELIAARIYRSVFSKRRLLERMVEFWTDHFNIDHQKDICQAWKTVDDREVIRKHALGTFPDMLRASAHSAAMLYYLDNSANIKGAPNENYPRELMELHTLGVDGPYHERDVKAAARCLTGWSFSVPPYVDIGEFRFYPENHDDGSKWFLGHLIRKDGGETDGDQVLDILATHPKTADFISRKMCRWLIGYTPSEELVRRTAQTYLTTGGDIKMMIREIFDRQRLRQADLQRERKLRRPYHFVVSLLRSTRASVDDLTAVFTHLLGLGQYPYGYSPPTGYPDALDVWGHSLLPRWSFASALLSNEIPGASVDLTQVMGLMGNPSPDHLAEGINRLLTGGALAAEDVAAVQAYIDSAPYFSATVAREAIALGASAPSYQFY